MIWAEILFEFTVTLAVNERQEHQQIIVAISTRTVNVKPRTGGIYSSPIGAPITASQPLHKA